MTNLSDFVRANKKVARFAKARNFSRVIYHGLLAASLLTEIGDRLDGWRLL
jgi:hypothetical protein